MHSLQEWVLSVHQLQLLHRVRERQLPPRRGLLSELNVPLWQRTSEQPMRGLPDCLHYMLRKDLQGLLVQLYPDHWTLPGNQL